MNPIRFLLTACGTTVIAWLGASFVMTAEPVPDEISSLASFLDLTENVQEPVRPSHPDAHRKGALLPETVELPPLPANPPTSPQASTFILDLASAASAEH